MIPRSTRYARRNVSSNCATGGASSYDLKSDPYELDNIAGSAPAKLLNELHRRVTELKTCREDGCRTAPPKRTPELSVPGAASRVVLRKESSDQESTGDDRMPQRRPIKRTLSRLSMPLRRRLGVRLPPREFLLHSLPRNSVGAEIGVWRGEFSADIVRRVRPRRLHLIDP